MHTSTRVCYKAYNQTDLKHWCCWCCAAWTLAQFEWHHCCSHWVWLQWTDRRRYISHKPDLCSASSRKACSLFSSHTAQFAAIQHLGFIHNPEHYVNFVSYCIVIMPSVLWWCWFGGRKSIRPVKTEWCDAGMVMCLGQGADLHIAQLMPLPLTISCSSKSRLVLLS